MKYVVLSLLVALVACGKGDDSIDQGSGIVSIKCVGVSNDNAQNCKATAGISASSGNVSRAQAMWISASFQNGTGQPFVGYRETIMSPGCNGEPSFVASSSNFILQPGESITSADARQCASMPLGPAQMQVVVYAGEAKTVCEHAPGAVCTTLPSGQVTCTPGDICTIRNSGPETDRGSAQYVVTN